MLQRVLALNLGALVTSSCGQSVDAFQDVEDLRVLALRAVPPEILLPTDQGTDPTNAEFEVNFEALVVNPSRRPIDIAWRFCPVESDDGCRDYAEIRDRTPRFASELDAMRSINLEQRGALPLDETEDFDPNTTPERAVWPYSIQTFTVEAPASLALYHAQTNFFGVGAGSYPSVQLRVTSAEDTVLNNKRFVLNVDHPSVLADRFRQEFDFDVCAPDQSPTTGCILLNPLVQNENPVFDRLEIAFSDQADAPFEVIPRRDDGTFEAPRIATEDKVRILPVFTESSFQNYQSLQTNVDTQEIQVRDQTEQISVSWFTSGGDIEDRFTWPPFTRTLDTVFTAPDTIPSEGSVSMWLVAQDQRGGSSWVQLELVVE